MTSWLLVLFLGCGEPEPAESLPTLHTVVRGESVAKLAKHYGVEVEQLVEWNRLSSPDQIEVGKVLIVGYGPHTTPKKESTKKKKRRVRAPAVPVSSGVQTTHSLTKPTPKPCLPPPDVLGDNGMVASAGLSEEQVRRAMYEFLGETVRCIPEGVHPQGELLLDVSVGCQGVVSDIRIEELADYPPEVASCIVDILRYTPFPAHDQPDGFSFGFPLHFSFE